MGRQIQFHMLSEDQAIFLRLVQDRDSVIITTRDGSSAKIEPCSNLASGSSESILCLWNRRILRHLERRWIATSGYYQVDVLNMPILEFTPSLHTTWLGRQALVQGRLFGNFESYLKKPEAFEKWYESIVRWIRNNYEKNPRDGKGYVGAAAYRFYQDGGYLLPNFVPPTTAAWISQIEKQHENLKKPMKSKRYII